MDVPLEDQIACVARELAMRKVVYPRRVAAGQMTQIKADAEVIRMQAVMDTLVICKAARDENLRERPE